MVSKDSTLADGEEYLTATEAATFLGIKRGLFYSNVKSRVKAYRQGAGRRWRYRQSELEPFRCIQSAAS